MEMKETWSRNSRKALYSGSMVIFIAIFYLVSVGSRFFQPSVSRLEWDEIKMAVLAVFYLTAGIIFLRKKKIGWILCAGILLNFVLVMCIFIFSLASSGPFSSYAAMAIILFLLILLAFVFLFGKEIRRQYRLNNGSYLLMVIVYVLVLAANFLI